MEITLRTQLAEEFMPDVTCAPSRCILWIESASSLNYVHDYFHDGIYFYHTPLLDEAFMIMNGDKLKIDAAVISPEHSAADILSMRECAGQKSIPFIMYTTVFEQEAKDLAARLGADEYHTGVVGSAFLKRIEFLKRLKKYKNHQSAGTDAIVCLKALPKLGRWALKRTFDLFGSFIALLALSPLFMFIAVVTRMGLNGPMFQVCKRVGMGHRTFDLYKFNIEADPYNRNTPLARIRRFLQESGLDELPSLLNVLKGDMSLVGSRPLPVTEAEKLTKDQMALRLMTPIGFTGLWRLKKLTTENRTTELDMEYAMGNSLWLDIKILLSTFMALPLHQKI